MRCCLTSIGSRGDVAPFVGLGQELQRRGHDVLLVVLEPWAPLVREAGLACHPVPLRDEALWPGSPLARRAMVAQPGLMYAGMLRQLGRAAPTVAASLAEAGRGADVLVDGLVSAGAGATLAASQGSASATLLLGPLLASRDPVRTVQGPRHVPGEVTKAVSEAMWRMTRGMGSAHTRAMARHLGRAAACAPAGGSSLTLLATSPLFSPPDPGWPPGVVQVGRITPTPPDGGLPADLAGWLAGNPGAVLMDFGSILRADAAADARLFRSAARRTGRSLLVQDGALPRGALANPGGVPAWNEPRVDHRLLLGELAAVVHHGGAGTTFTALAAQCPQVVVPHLGDQAYYARRVPGLGVGTSPGPRWRTTARLLARALERALAAPVPARCRQLGPRLAAEDGAARAADQLEALARAGR